jgi:RNA polymerase sigma factor (sigma-70 family)
MNAEQAEALLGDWLKEHGQRILLIIKRLVRREDDAQDIMQDIRLKLWQALEAGKAPLESPANAKWLTKVALRTAFDFRKKQKRRESRRLPFDDTGVSYPPSDPAIQRAREVTELMKEALPIAVESLDWELRIIMRLRSKGAKLREIADQLGLRIDIVWRRQGRAIKILRHALEPLRQELEDIEDRTPASTHQAIRKKRRS